MATASPMARRSPWAPIRTTRTPTTTASTTPPTTIPWTTAQAAVQTIRRATTTAPTGTTAERDDAPGAYADERRSRAGDSPRATRGGPRPVKRRVPAELRRRHGRRAVVASKAGRLGRPGGRLPAGARFRRARVAGRRRQSRSCVAPPHPSGWRARRERLEVRSMADLVIRGAALCDGTGREAMRGDLAVQGDRIVAL